MDSVFTVLQAQKSKVKAAGFVYAEGVLCSTVVPYMLHPPWKARVLTQHKRTKVERDSPALLTGPHLMILIYVSSSQREL